jgi:hypothetical protein
MRRPVSDHLPDCTELWSIDDYLHHARPDDPEKCDYCKAFRAAEQRVRDTTLHIDPIGYAAKHYGQGQRDERAKFVNPNCVWGEGECIPGCPSCKRMDELISEREAGALEERKLIRTGVEALATTDLTYFGMERVDKPAVLAVIDGGGEQR